MKKIKILNEQYDSYDTAKVRIDEFIFSFNSNCILDLNDKQLEKISCYDTINKIILRKCPILSKFNFKLSEKTYYHFTSFIFTFETKDGIICETKINFYYKNSVFDFINNEYQVSLIFKNKKNKDSIFKIDDLNDLLSIKEKETGIKGLVYILFKLNNKIKELDNLYIETFFRSLF